MKTLTNEDTKSIFKKEFFRVSNFYTTIFYVLKTKQNNNISWETLSKKNVNGYSIILLLWAIFKYILIPIELIRVRKQIFKMLFNQNAPEFTETELVRLVTETTNVWLSSNYDKVRLLENFCDKLLSDEYICEKICSITKATPKDYQLIRTKVLEIFQRYESSVLEKAQNKAKKELWERFGELDSEVLQTQEKQAKSYLEEFESDFLLIKGE